MWYLMSKNYMDMMKDIMASGSVLPLKKYRLAMEAAELTILEFNDWDVHYIYKSSLKDTRLF